LKQDYWDEKKTQPKNQLSLYGLVVKGRVEFHRPLFHCILVENQVQAIATDCLGIGLCNADKANIQTVLHVHDELAAEEREDRVEQMMPVFKQAMLDMPAWTVGLPMAADVSYGARFG
jgi:hypothetical protein